MKKNQLFSFTRCIITAVCALMCFIACKHEEPLGDATLCVVQTNIQTSESNNSIFVQNDNSIKSIELEFNESLDGKTLSNSILLDSIGKGGELHHVDISIDLSADKTKVSITPSEDKLFENNGGQFVIHVSDKLLSEKRNYLKEDYVDFFMTLPEKYESSGFLGYKSYTVIISDIHLGDKRSQDEGYCWFTENKKKLEEFLDYINYYRSYYKELVIAGDLFDEWVAPMDKIPFGDSDNNKITQSQFVKNIAEANKTIIDKIIALKTAGVNIVYIPGNHDMLVEESDINAIFGDGVVTQARDKKGLGLYEPQKDIAIEHGHRYDFFNAPDMVSNIGIEGITSDNAILPAGFFVTKVATTHDMGSSSLSSLGKLNLSLSDYNIKDLEEAAIESDEYCKVLYNIAWLAINNQKQVGITLPIKTGLCGLNNDYNLRQITPAYYDTYQLLYRDTYKVANWNSRLRANGSILIPFTLGVLAGAVNMSYEYIAQWIHLGGNGKKITVFGHTHEPVLKYKWRIGTFYSGIYANAGTWVDKKYAGDFPTCTFVTIYEGTGIFSEYKSVYLQQFLGYREGVKDISERLWVRTTNQ